MHNSIIAARKTNYFSYERGAHHTRALTFVSVLLLGALNDWFKTNYRLLFPKLFIRHSTTSTLFLEQTKKETKQSCAMLLYSLLKNMWRGGGFRSYDVLWVQSPISLSTKSKSCDFYTLFFRRCDRRWHPILKKFCENRVQLHESEAAVTRYTM